MCGKKRDMRGWIPDGTDRRRTVQKSFRRKGFMEVKRAAQMQ